MKSLIQHIKADGSSLIPLEEKLRINKDWKPDIESMVNDAVNNHITKVPDKFNVTNNTFHRGWTEIYQFHSADDFIAVFDELDIPYDIEENKNIPTSPMVGNGRQYWIILKLNDTYTWTNIKYGGKIFKYDKLFIKNYHIDGIDGCWAIELYDKNNVKYSIQGQINNVRVPKNPNIKNYEEQLTLHYYSGFLKKEIDEVIKPFFIELLEQIEGEKS